MLDGLVYGEGESAKSIVVTTDSLLDKWLLGRPKGRSIDDIPTSAAAAVKTENFYAQAVNSDSAAAMWRVPVAAPPGAKFAHAMLSLIGNGPLVPGTPDRIFVALEQGGRVFIVSEKLATPVPPSSACDAAGAGAATKKADAADSGFMKGGGKNKKLLDQVENCATKPTPPSARVSRARSKAHPRSRPLKSRRKQSSRR